MPLLIVTGTGQLKDLPRPAANSFSRHDGRHLCGGL